MKTRGWKIEDGGWLARSVLECGGPRPLSPSTGFTLQQNPSLATTNWVNATPLPTVVGSEKQVIASPPAGNRFYRLKKP